MTLVFNQSDIFTVPMTLIISEMVYLSNQLNEVLLRENSSHHVKGVFCIIIQGSYVLILAVFLSMILIRMCSVYHRGVSESMCS
jgi:hypothetical protein